LLQQVDPTLKMGIHGCAAVLQDEGFREDDA
jgi:hypothetical protein